MAYTLIKATQIHSVHNANLVANSGKWAWGVESICNSYDVALRASYVCLPRVIWRKVTVPMKHPWRIWAKKPHESVQIWWHNQYDRKHNKTVCTLFMLWNSEKLFRKPFRTLKSRDLIAVTLLCHQRPVKLAQSHVADMPKIKKINRPSPPSKQFSR